MVKSVAAAMLLLGAVAALAADEPMGVERMARFTYPGYESGAPSDATMRWVQLDLGKSVAIETVKLMPHQDWGGGSVGFPARFKLEASDDPEGKAATTIADQTAADYPSPGDAVAIFAAKGITGRYLRLTATRLRQKQLTLCRVEVWSGGKDAALGRPLSDWADAKLRVTSLTRAPRPNGEGVVTDNPKNVIPVEQWQPVRYAAQVPRSGITLGDSPLRTAMVNNITYLMSTFTLDELARQFRDRAGLPQPGGMRPPNGFWETTLAGSNAGRFLMGAGNTVRWIDDPALHQRMDQLVDIIDQCKRADGYCMAYPDDTIFFNERGAYTRSWLTHGLVDAGFGGNPKAFGLLRGYYDWFDQCRYRPELLRRCGQGVQGMIGNAETYFTPIGKPADLQVLQRYFQEDYWLAQLAARDLRAIWQYPYDRPHCYLITSLEPYLDLYRATGAKKYLDAATGGWQLYHDNWEHVGGTIAICEGGFYPPKSYFLHRETGELCGSVFWTRYNQRFHLLWPDQEKFVNEIEKSIYNVGLANQLEGKGIRYTAKLVGHKDNHNGTANNTCCEGQGTRLYGALPEYLYSLAPDGLYVDLYSASTITWPQAGKSLKLTCDTKFPFDGAVKLTLGGDLPRQSTLRLRVPTWAAADMPVSVNGKLVATGKAGSYLVLKRVWQAGDAITFTLPMALRASRYEGAERDPRRERYALEYGPILLALVGAVDERTTRLSCDPAELTRQLRPKPGQPLHFTIAGDETHEYLPYWQVNDEAFTCYPLVGVDAGAEKPETVGANDLALASRGAVATSDGEYANEPGCTARAIDGVIGTMDDFSNRWHSSLDTPHPHWIQVKLPKATALGKVVIHFADPAGWPTSFQGIAKVDGRDKVVFDVKDYTDRRKYEAKLGGVVTDTFRLLIRESGSLSWPNAAQVSEIELCP